MVAEGGWQRRGGVLELAPLGFGPSRRESTRGEPSRPPAGVLEFIGGSYLATTPQISYRRLLEALAARGWLLRAWSYVPGFDHQSQANEAWRAFRRAREESPPLEGTPVVRLGHSLGCKLHLLAPDNGRACSGLVALSFNNFSAERSVPLLGELGQQFGFRSEFSPSPTETLRLVGRSYRQPRNLLVRFRGDGLDQSRRLHAVLQERPNDATTLLDLPGDHLTPASAGLRRQLLGDWADDPSRQRQIDRLADTICAWGLREGSDQPQQG
ncbi:MAG: DUF1350 family protein [Cyanobacteriota bacterium]|nr:DUF1350 family protein [Cyanobacteriota bacterium]